MQFRKTAGGAAVACACLLGAAAVVVAACANYLDADAGAAGGPDAQSNVEATTDAGLADSTSPFDAPSNGSDGPASGSDAHGPGPDGGGAHDAAPFGDAGLSPYALAVLDASPILYLRFDDDGQTGTARDFSGNGNSGTYPSGGVTYGVPGALTGGGDDDPAIHLSQNPTLRANTVTMPPCADFDGGAAPFTVELWFHPDLDAGATLLVDHEVDQPVRGGWDLNLQPEPVEFDRGYWADGAPLLIAFSNTWTTPGWHYLVAVYDVQRQEQYVYLDDVEGTFQGTTGTPINLPAVGPWSVGGENCECTENGFMGAIDELAVYGTVLQKVDIDDHWHKATGM